MRKERKKKGTGGKIKPGRAQLGKKMDQLVEYTFLLAIDSDHVQCVTRGHLSSRREHEL